jgi:ribosomal protein S18 acetylase RimI-like enzyme
MVLFPEHEEYSESAAREGCAEIRDVGVAEDYRRRGIGAAMLRALERIAHDRGAERIGLSVATEEQPARDLYAKLGYGHAHGPFLISARLDTDDGAGLPVGPDPVVYLTKSLA